MFFVQNSLLAVAVGLASVIVSAYHAIVWSEPVRILSVGLNVLAWIFVIWSLGCTFPLHLPIPLLPFFSLLSLCLCRVMHSHSPYPPVILTGYLRPIFFHCRRSKFFADAAELFSNGTSDSNTRLQALAVLSLLQGFTQTTRTALSFILA